MCKDIKELINVYIIVASEEYDIKYILYHGHEWGVRYKIYFIR